MKNYREQEFEKCCGKCEHLGKYAMVTAYGLFFCKINKHDPTASKSVSKNGICDNYEPKEK